MAVSGYKRIYDASTLAVDHNDHYLLVDKSGSSSASKVLASTITKGEFNPATWGASPSASAATNTAAIVAAVAASSNGTFGSVVLGPGAFKVTGDVITLTRVESSNRVCPIFKGAGRHATKLILEAGDDGAILTVTGSWQIRDMSFVGTEIAPGGLGAEGIGAFVRRMTEGGGFTDCNFSILEFGILTDAYQSFAAGSAMQGCFFERCIFEACTEAGVWLEDVMNANHISQCVFLNGYPSVVGNHGYGLRVGGISSNMIVEKCQFLSHKHGIAVAGTTGLVIRDSYFETTWTESGAYIAVDGLATDVRDMTTRRQTLANGSASAGQKTIVVDDTSLFYANQYIYYALVGGSIERNRIQYVDSGTQMRVYTNIGTGGIPNNGPITGIEWNENVTIENCVCSFHYTSGDPTGTFLQLRDARNTTVAKCWSTSYGAGLVDLLDDNQNPTITTVKGLVLLNNLNSHANTPVLRGGTAYPPYDLIDGSTSLIIDTYKETGETYLHLPRTIYSLPNNAGEKGFALMSDTTLLLAADTLAVDLKTGLRIDAGTRISKYLANVEATLDFGSIPAHSTAELNFAFTGARISDQVIIAPVWTIEAGLMWGAYVNTSDYVTVRLANVTGSLIDPASGVWAISLLKH